MCWVTPCWDHNKYLVSVFFVADICILHAAFRLIDARFQAAFYHQAYDLEVEILFPQKKIKRASKSLCMILKVAFKKLVLQYFKKRMS